MKEEKKVLPNPELGREPTVPQCKGCERVYDDGTLPLTVCVCYESPKAKWRNHRVGSVSVKKGSDVADVRVDYHPCNMATHVRHHQKENTIFTRQGQQKQKKKK